MGLGQLPVESLEDVPTHQAGGQVADDTNLSVYNGDLDVPRAPHGKRNLELITRFLDGRARCKNDLVGDISRGGNGHGVCR